MADTLVHPPMASVHQHSSPIKPGYPPSFDVLGSPTGRESPRGVLPIRATEEEVDALADPPTDAMRKLELATDEPVAPSTPPEKDTARSNICQLLRACMEWGEGRNFRFEFPLSSDEFREMFKLGEGAGGCSVRLDEKGILATFGQEGAVKLFTCGVSHVNNGQRGIGQIQELAVDFDEARGAANFAGSWRPVLVCSQ